MKYKTSLLALLLVPVLLVSFPQHGPAPLYAGTGDPVMQRTAHDAAGVTFAQPAASNPTSRSKAAQIEALIKPFVDNDLFHGTVLVSEEGRIIYKKGFGYADMEWRIPSDTDTKYRIASISKQFTALIVLQLQEEGKIDITRPISDYLPDYRKDTGEKVTVHHLLTHTSGIPNGGHVTRGFWSRSEHTRIHYSKKEFIERFCSGDLEFEPGSQFRYSSIGYILLGAIIEEVCGTPFPQVFAERVADIIRLADTSCDDNVSIVDKRARGYSRNDFGWRNSIYHYMPILDGAGTILTTVEDLFKYDQALYTERLLSRESMGLFYDPPNSLDDLPTDEDRYYSYGWEISRLDDPASREPIRLISHGGGIRGGSGYICRQPEGNNTVIILSNTEIGSVILGDLGLDMIRILNGMEPVIENHIPIKLVLGREIIASGLDAAIGKYRELKANEPELYDFGAGQLNSLGYSLMYRGMLDESVEILKLNVEIYPDDANGYDSLGEAYMTNGNRELAIANYERSLELDPGNENAREMLKKLRADG